MKIHKHTIKHLIPDGGLVMPKCVKHLIFNNCNFELGVTGLILPSVCVVSRWNV